MLIYEIIFFARDYITCIHIIKKKKIKGLKKVEKGSTLFYFFYGF